MARKLRKITDYNIVRHYRACCVSWYRNWKGFAIYVHNSQRSNCLEDVLWALNGISVSYENTVLCGDLNVDLSLDDQRATQLRNSISFMEDGDILSPGSHALLLVDAMRKCGSHYQSSIQSNAVEDDNISFKFLKLILLGIIFPPLTHVLNHITPTRSFLDTWRVAIITSISKKFTSVFSQDFRLIRILPVLSKIIIYNPVCIFPLI